MKKIYWVVLITVLLLAPFWYYFFLIPNFKKCVEETGTWRACTQWLIR